MPKIEDYQVLHAFAKMDSTMMEHQFANLAMLSVKLVMDHHLMSVLAVLLRN
jgi:hypothetical protein